MARSWREGVNLAYARRLVVGHLLLWGYGVVLVAARLMAPPEEPAIRVLGGVGLALFAVSLVVWIPLLGKPSGIDEDGMPAISFPAFFAVLISLLSSGAFMVLLSALGFDSIPLG